MECSAVERATLTATRLPVAADDVTIAVHLALAALREVPEGHWRAPAGSLEWDSWETVEHLNDDLFAYAAQLGPRKPPLDREVPFRWGADRKGGPANSIFANPDAGPVGLLQTLEASGALLTAMVRTTSADVRSYHSYGVSDPEGFAAMGIVETLVHTHDVVQGLDISWAPPADLCDRVLARLFPDAPDDADRWAVLLWSTGRAELPGGSASPRGSGAARRSMPPRLCGHSLPSTGGRTSSLPGAASRCSRTAPGSPMRCRTPGLPGPIRYR